MEDYSQKAVDYFKAGYNCAQAVFLAFASHYGFDDETALKLSSSFGGGMGEDNDRGWQHRSGQRSNSHDLKPPSKRLLTDCYVEKYFFILGRPIAADST